MQKEEYLIKNACYSVTKYYLCKQNNKRSLLGRKQRNQVASSFPNRYLFSFTNKVTCLFSIRYTLINIFSCKDFDLLKTYGEERYGYFYLENYHAVYSLEGGINTNICMDSLFI